MAQTLEARLWEQLRLAWREPEQEALQALEQSLALCAPLPLAWAMSGQASEQIGESERGTFLFWLLNQARMSQSVFWLHLLGFCAWEGTASQKPSQRDALDLLAGPFEAWLAQKDAVSGFSDRDMPEQFDLLEADYLEWDRLVGRKPSAWLRAYCLHAFARANAVNKSQNPIERTFARPLQVVCLRRLSDDPEGAAQQFEGLDAVDWSTHIVGANYLAVLDRFRAYCHLARDRHRADQARQLYFQRIAQAQDADRVLQERVNAYLQANDLRLASLQGLVRVPGNEGNGLTYRLLNLHDEDEQSFAGLGIYGWHGEQWQSYLKLGKLYQARQATYQAALAANWQHIGIDDLEKLYPAERYETVWIAGADMALYSLCDKLLQPEADCGAILALAGLDHWGQKLDALIDALERLLIRARSHRATLSWPSQIEPLVLVAWVLGHGLLSSKEPAACLRQNAERFMRRELPSDFPAVLQMHSAWYLTLTPKTWRSALPWPLFEDEVSLGAADRPYVCFVHPLGYERLEQGSSRVPTALVCGRFYMPAGTELPFVAGSYKHYLQPVLELCRHLIDLAVQQQGKAYAERLSAQAVELAAVQESQTRFRRIQEQMRAFDRAKHEMDSIWHGISHALTPPAYAAYGILDWQRLLDVFDDGKSIRGIKGAHNLASVTAAQLDVFLTHLTEGQILTETFIGQLQSSWSRMESPGDQQARCYFALLKLVALDGFARGKPLALVQLLVALRLAMPRPGLRLSFAFETEASRQDLSWLLSADDCPMDRFFTGLGELSGFDFARGAYTLNTPSHHALPLAAGLAGDLCQRLTQLLCEELYRPDQPRWLRVTRVDALWRSSIRGDTCLLWLECDKPFEPDLPTRLEPGDDGLPHGLRDCLESLRQATGGHGIDFGEVLDRQNIPECSGLSCWNLTSERRCLIRLQLGGESGVSIGQSLQTWRNHWLAGNLRPEGI